ncbi:MAG TPA: hypothetical protein VN643_23525 [Pyrinomonadaceae bacterium]|nr:hypothetical protein [Pyrinomonadaceae bacterium]
MKYVILLVVGILLGGGGAIYWLGSPRAHKLPGTPVQAPAPGGDAPGTLVMGLDDKFFEQVLGSIFRDLGSPALQLSQKNEESSPMQPAVFQSGCANTITVLQETDGVKTRVQFTGGKIMVPLAFNGSYSLMGNCMQFKGWAQSSIQMSFDQSKQTVYGQLNVEGVNLEGVAPVANSMLTVFVQNAINQRVNPLELVRAPQLAPVIPVKASGGVLKAQVKDVRAEILDGSLKLHITYDFKGEKN